MKIKIKNIKIIKHSLDNIGYIRVLSRIVKTSKTKVELVNRTLQLGAKRIEFQKETLKVNFYISTNMEIYR